MEVIQNILNDDHIARLPENRSHVFNDRDLCNFSVEIDNIELIDYQQFPHIKGRTGWDHIRSLEDVVPFRTFKQKFTQRFPTISKIIEEEHNNMVIAGGSILTCLQKDSNDSIIIDCDIFIYGLTEEEAKSKVERLVEQILQERDDCECNIIRGRHQVTIVLDISPGLVEVYQIVFRLYRSKMEVIQGFDLNIASVCYDGKALWSTKAALYCIKNQIEIVDIRRHCWRFNRRLEKYNMIKGITIIFPGLVPRAKYLRENSLSPFIWHSIPQCYHTMRGDHAALFAEYTDINLDGAPMRTQSIKFIEFVFLTRKFFATTCEREDALSILHTPLFMMTDEECQNAIVTFLDKAMETPNKKLTLYRSLTKYVPDPAALQKVIDCRDNFNKWEWEIKSEDDYLCISPFNVDMTVNEFYGELHVD